MCPELHSCEPVESGLDIHLTYERTTATTLASLHVYISQRLSTAKLHISFGPQILQMSKAENVSTRVVMDDSIQPVIAVGGDADLDELQLQAQGHTGELPRHFSMMSLLAFSFSIMNSWTGVAPLLITNLSLGGPTAAFWTPILACIASSIIGLSLAELASAFPSSGGQYQYV